eukprot:2681393-Amphidinium_carterae.2
MEEAACNMAGEIPTGETSSARTHGVLYNSWVEIAVGGGDLMMAVHSAHQQFGPARCWQK